MKPTLTTLAAHLTAQAETRHRQGLAYAANGYETWHAFARADVRKFCAMALLAVIAFAQNQKTPRRQALKAEARKLLQEIAE